MASPRMFVFLLFFLSTFPFCCLSGSSNRALCLWQGVGTVGWKAGRGSAAIFFLLSSCFLSSSNNHPSEEYKLLCFAIHVARFPSLNFPSISLMILVFLFSDFISQLGVRCEWKAVTGARASSLIEPNLPPRSNLSTRLRHPPRAAGGYRSITSCRLIPRRPGQTPVPEFDAVGETEISGNLIQLAFQPVVCRCLVSAGLALNYGLLLALWLLIDYLSLSLFSFLSTDRPTVSSTISTCCNLWEVLC